MDTWQILTGAAALLFASNFLAGGRMSLPCSLADAAPHGSLKKMAPSSATALSAGVWVLIEIRWGVLDLLFAFISGAIVVNSAINGVVPQKDGWLLPFKATGTLYGSVNIPLG